MGNSIADVADIYGLRRDWLGWDEGPPEWSIQGPADLRHPRVSESHLSSLLYTGYNKIFFTCSIKVYNFSTNKFNINMTNACVWSRIVYMTDICF